MAHAAEMERLRRPSDVAWSALHQSGFFYQFVPKVFGGMATDMDSLIDATLPIAEACPSTAWVSTFCAKHNWFLAHFPLKTQSDLRGGAYPCIVAPAVSAPPRLAVRVDGGFPVTGAWKWGAGVMHADWVIAVTLLNEGSGPQQPTASLFPAEVAEVLDIRRADGMAETGSKDIRVVDLFVPEVRTLPLAGCLSGRGPGWRRCPEPIYSAHGSVFHRDGSRARAWRGAERTRSLS